ncbi:MAG: DUF1926 domain-containing protein [Pirellulaceae bacterium]|nr:DUF1926 domain-containing protein [Pirellulaceae bacterium]
MVLGLDRQPVSDAPKPQGAIAQLLHRWQYLTSRLACLQQDGHEEPTLSQAKWHLYCACYHSSSSHFTERPTLHEGDSESSASTLAWVADLSADAQQSVRRNLIEAENLLDEFSIQRPETIDALLHDFDGDGDAEIRVANSHLIAWLDPAAGGQLFGLDARSVGQNVLASGVPSFVEYFWYPQIQSGEVQDYLNRADHSFANHSYHGQLRQGPGRVQILLQQQAMVYDLPLRVSKAITMLECSDELEVTYVIEGLPDGLLLNFGSLWHWAGVGSDATNRFVHDLSGHRLGSGQRSLYLPQSAGIGLCDVWSGIDLQLKTPEICRLVASPTHPTQTSTQVASYLAVMPHWIVSGDTQGRWSVKFKLRVDPTPTDVRKTPT